MNFSHYILLTLIVIGLTALLRIIQLRSYTRMHLFFSFFLPLLVIGGLFWLVGSSNTLASSLFYDIGKPMTILSIIGLIAGYSWLYAIKR
ncbi:hypothetical protein [Alkalibacillus almallahensis]|uniref:hypothetical protein n=1 Tax=Alkalibacillus almallahensis TaxID=1379154 RepID=UPI001421E173|nr:hypothetical protein [Alkalibacillus almallahensis]NIK13074.1 hypothetical protein [Alkalibacillus almallahensis]